MKHRVPRILSKRADTQEVSVCQMIPPTGPAQLRHERIHMAEAEKGRRRSRDQESCSSGFAPAAWSSELECPAGKGKTLRFTVVPGALVAQGGGQARQERDRQLGLNG